MGTVVEDVKTSAEWISVALQSSGYRADFTPQSFWELDRFFDEHSRDGQAVQGGLLSQDLGGRVFALGCYIGEVLRRERGGDWYADDADPQVEVNLELRLSDGSVCWPIQRIMKRFALGEEEGLAVYGQGFGLNVGPKPSERKSWWKVW